MKSLVSSSSSTNSVQVSSCDPYEEGITKAVETLKTHGMALLAQGPRAACVGFGKALYDFKVLDSDKVVHIAGRGSSTKLSEAGVSPLCLQLIIATPGQGASPPVYVDLPASLENPAQTIYENILLFLRRKDMPALPEGLRQVNQSSEASSVK